MGSYYDFIAQYGKEIIDLVNKGKLIAARIEKEVESLPEEQREAAWQKKISAIMNHIDSTYDKPVAGLIDRILTGGRDIDVKEVADIALDISNRYGTEMRQVVNALEDAFGYEGRDEEIDQQELDEAFGKFNEKILEDFKQKTRKILQEVAPEGWEGTVKAMKKHKGVKNPWALAWYMKNKGYKSHKKDV